MKSLCHTPGLWTVAPGSRGIAIVNREWETPLIASVSCNALLCEAVEANARLIAAAPDLLAALHEGRRAIGDHFAPNDCYATGPLTGDDYRDLVQCPACSFISMYDAAIAKAEGYTNA